MKRKNITPPKPVRSPQVPVTVQMLSEMEERLAYKMDSNVQHFRTEVKAQFGDVNAEFGRVNGQFESLKAEIGGLKAEFLGVKSELHRVALLVEEQNARNKFVLDGYAQLYELIERKLA